MSNDKSNLPIDRIIHNCEERKKKRLFHGSLEVVSRPQFGLGSSKNDFGKGFYCTEIEYLAKEWAAQSLDKSGYCNEYLFDMSGLVVLDLTQPKYNLLNWLALLYKYRDFATHSYDAKENMKYLQENFAVDINSCDVIIGYRADDSYFTWAKEFVEDQITYELLKRAMMYGGLGNQIVLVSQRAFSKIEFVKSTEVDRSFFYQRNARAIKADKRYFREKEETPKSDDELTASKIRKGGLKNEDFCVSRDVQGYCGR